MYYIVQVWNKQEVTENSSATKNLVSLTSIYQLLGPTIPSILCNGLLVFKNGFSTIALNTSRCFLIVDKVYERERRL